MNPTTLQTSINAKDYSETMQAVAEGYLQRHWGEHLDDGQLFERTCQYLVTANEVPVFMAQRLVYLAMSKITPPSITVTVGVDLASDEDKTVVAQWLARDRIHQLVPRRLQPYQQRFLAQATPH